MAVKSNVSNDYLLVLLLPLLVVMAVFLFDRQELCKLTAVQ